MEQNTNYQPPAPTTPPSNFDPNPKSDTDILGIISIICVFTGMSLIGFVLGLVGVKKAKEENRSATLSKIGWIINLIAMILFIVLMVSLIALGVFSAKRNTNKSPNITNDNSTTQIEKQSKDYSKGEAAQFGDFKVKVTNVTRNYVAPDSFTKPDDDKEFIVLDIQAQNTSEKSSSLSVYSFKLNAGNGMLETPHYAKTPGAKLESGSVVANGTVTGQLIYEVPAGAQNLKLEFEDYVYNRKTYKSEVVKSTLAL